MKHANLIFWGPKAWIVAVLFTFALAGGLEWIFGTTYAERHRERLYQEPISRIQSIRICPGNNFPLVDHEVVITNTAMIQEIMAAIRSAKTYFPNHPATRWSCVLAISSASGTSDILVIESLGQNTLLYCPTSPIVYDTLQSTALGQILERATAK